MEKHTVYNRIKRIHPMLKKVISGVTIYTRATLIRRIGTLKCIEKYIIIYEWFISNILKWCICRDNSIY